MKTTLYAVIALVTLCAATHAQEFDWNAGAKKAATVQSQLTFTPSDYVYRVSARAGLVSNEAGCVPIGKGRFLTVAHILHDLSRPTIWVRYNGQWNPATFQQLKGEDFAVVTTNANADIPYVVPRTPKYLEKVIYYGLTTGLQVGTYTANGTVSLEPGGRGNVNGDSGGGVFSLDGELLGIIRGNDDESKPLANTLVAKMTPMVGANSATINSVAPVSANDTFIAPPMMYGGSYNCANGQCSPNQQLQMLQGYTNSLPPLSTYYKVRTGPFGRQRLQQITR